MLWAAVLTAPVAHARIVRIDVTGARAIPGVHAVLTGADIGERHLGRVLFDWPVLAFEKVRFVGDHVAAVAAETREIANAALASIVVEYDELPPIFDPEESIAGTMFIHEQPERYVYNMPPRPPVPHRNMQGYDSTLQGDVEVGFAQAIRTFEHTFTTPRYLPGYIEPRATLVWIEPNGTVHVITTNKAPFALREQLAITTGLAPEADRRPSRSYIGGDFGSKGLSIEEFQCYYLANATGRPVKHVRSYSDDMRACVVRHASKITIRSGVDAAGMFVALDARLLYDGGAYAAGKPTPGLIPGGKMKTPYAFRHSRVERICAYTNTIPSGQVRDPAGVPLVFAIESHVDMVARELGLNPLEFRRRNAIRAPDFDLDGTRYVEPQAVAVLDALCAAVDWERPLPAGYRGRGIALTSRHVGDGKANLRLTIARSGAVAVHTGAAEQGGGVLTVAARILAPVLDIDPQTIIMVKRGDTSSVPYDTGTGASRQTHIVGRAALDAAQQLRARLEVVGYLGGRLGGSDCRSHPRGSDRDRLEAYDEQHQSGDPESAQLLRILRRAFDRSGDRAINDSRCRVRRRLRNGDQPGGPPRTDRWRLCLWTRPRTNRRGVPRGWEDRQSVACGIQAANPEGYAPVPGSHASRRSRPRTLRCEDGRRTGARRACRPRSPTPSRLPAERASPPSRSPLNGYSLGLRPLATARRDGSLQRFAAWFARSDPGFLRCIPAANDDRIEADAALAAVGVVVIAV